MRNNGQQKATVTSLFGNMWNPSTDIAIGNEEIREPHRSNLNDIDEAFDMVRRLIEFSGKRWQFNLWRKSVEAVH